MLAELRTLKQLRLDRQWTWEELAAHMNRVIDPPISMRTLHHLLTYARSRPRDTTLHKIRLFRDWHTAAEKRRQRTRRRRRAHDAETVTPAAP